MSDGPTPAEVAASLRRLADLIETDAEFAAVAASAYFMQRYSSEPQQVLMSISHVDDPAGAMLAVAEAAHGAGVEVSNAADEKWRAVNLHFGTFNLFVYGDPDSFRGEVTS